ncbi:nitrous oxide-stimulated promoter family protein [Gudongella sp. DL1XJH-153]|uniref:nitrous oxide-stimulated promoter family protein n=1 Tax=Gudongella sp. DL1XJH-153 TaxID=3409804 RepID=UPI003BB5C3D8
MKSLSVQEKIQREKEIVSLMIDLYYKGNSNSFTKTQYLELTDYCLSKVDNCPFIEKKTFCSSCSVHCYDEKHRGMIKAVMKYSAPRMILYHPLLMLRHTILSLNNK